LTRITGTLYEDQCTFIIVARWSILRRRNVSGKRCRKYQNIHLAFNNFFSEIQAVYEIMWKNMVEANRPQMAI